MKVCPSSCFRPFSSTASCSRHLDTMWRDLCACWSPGDLLCVIVSQSYSFLLTALELIFLSYTNSAKPTVFTVALSVFPADFIIQWVGWCLSTGKSSASTRFWLQVDLDLLLQVNSAVFSSSYFDSLTQPLQGWLLTFFLVLAAN